MQGARPGRHEACEIRGAMGLEMPLQKELAPLMTTVTQDNDAHDNSENGGVEYNTCV